MTISSSNNGLLDLRDTLREFATARGWRQYHTPKNLAMALIVEAAELVEHFQWATPKERSQVSATRHLSRQSRSPLPADCALMHMLNSPAIEKV